MNYLHFTDTNLCWLITQKPSLWTTSLYAYPVKLSLDNKYVSLLLIHQFTITKLGKHKTQRNRTEVVFTSEKYTQVVQQWLVTPKFTDCVRTSFKTLKGHYASGTYTLKWFICLETRLVVNIVYTGLLCFPYKCLPLGRHLYFPKLFHYINMWD